MPHVNLMVGKNEQEELFYCREVVKALGKKQGEYYLTQVDATRKKNGCLPLLLDAQLKDILEQTK